MIKTITKLVLFSFHRLLLFRHRKSPVVYWKRYMIPIIDEYRKLNEKETF